MSTKLLQTRERLEALIDNLGSDATILIKNENKLNQMLPGGQILESLTPIAKVEFVENSITQDGGDVKGEYSISESNDYNVERQEAEEATSPDGAEFSISTYAFSENDA